MRLLLDTHAFVWAMVSDARLSAAASDAVGDYANEILVSPASVYELEYKRPRDAELAKLPGDLVTAAFRIGFEWLPISAAHANLAAQLPRLHKDPWDRILVAQAIVEGASLVTVDRALSAYDVATLW